MYTFFSLGRSTGQVLGHEDKENTRTTEAQWNTDRYWKQNPRVRNKLTGILASGRRNCTEHEKQRLLHCMSAGKLEDLEGNKFPGQMRKKFTGLKKEKVVPSWPGN